MALAGTDTPSLLEILEGSFGHVDLDVSTSSASIEMPIKKSTAAEKSPEKPSEKTSEKPSVPLSKEGSSASAELVFPLKYIPLIIASLPELFLPLHGPETLSHYRCQHTSCNQEFSQKAVACNHVCCDHLNIALACLYCSFDDNPKMWWYSASTLEHHTCKHALNNLPIYPDDPAFFQQFAETEAIPSTSKITAELPHVDIICK